MAITLKLFSSLMEYLPSGSEGNTVIVRVQGSLSCNQLIDRYGIPRDVVQVTMVNGQYLSPELRDQPLSDGDTVSVWPSIQGG